MAAEADAVRCEHRRRRRDGERDGKHGAATTVETSDVGRASNDGPTERRDDLGGEDTLVRAFDRTALSLKKPG